MIKRNSKTLAAAVGAAFIASAAATPGLLAGENPFQLSDLGAGYKVADAHKEGGCGSDKGEEGKCGEDKADGEGKCGEEKAEGEGKCGEEKAEGEGKCGEEKADDEGNGGES